MKKCFRVERIEINFTKMRKGKPILPDDSVDMLVQGKAISLGHRPIKPKPVVSAPPTPTKKPKKLKHKTAPTEPASKIRKSENDTVVTLTY